MWRTEGGKVLESRVELEAIEESTMTAVATGTYDIATTRVARVHHAVSVRLRAGILALAT